MAYVLWRVFMKKYSRVRLGIHKAPVTPTGRHIRSFEESSWKPVEETPQDFQTVDDLKPEELARQSEERQSKTKRVKNYLKKCKNVLSGTNSATPTTTTAPVTNEQRTAAEQCAYWYVDNGDDTEYQTSEYNDAVCDNCDDVFEKVGPNYSRSSEVNVSAETLVDCSAINDDEIADILREDFQDCEDKLTDSLPTLVSEQDVVEEIGEQLSRASENENKGDVASLVDRLMGPLYPNYERTRPVLVRQARDLLVCEYLGNLVRFEAEFCAPAAALLAKIKEQIEMECTSGLESPYGWPLSLGLAGVIIHLGPLAPALLRNRDCYLCVRGRSAPGLEVALVWRRSGVIRCRTVAEFMDPIHNPHQITCTRMKTLSDMEMVTLEDLDDEHNLPELLQNLLVSVEHAIERVPLDDLAFPCNQCHQYLPLNVLDNNRSTSDSSNETNNAVVCCTCQCSCVLPDSTVGVVVTKDTSIQTSPMFEFAGAIPHIDSDEDDDKDFYRSTGSLKRSMEISTPKTIQEIPEKLLMSGINLPGTHDRTGRPIILCDAPCVSRAGLNRYEVATLLLYYASIPSKKRLEFGVTILVLAETAETTTLDILDKAISLTKSLVKISSVLVWRPGSKNTEPAVLASCKIKTIAVCDESALERHMERDQAPASCGGSCTHDQLEWVEFFRELEPFLEQCQTIGHALLTALSEIREQEIPTQIVRRFLHHQQRQLNRALQEPGLQALRRTGSITLESLTERAQWLNNSEDVKKKSVYARHSFSVADKVAKRLEQLAAERRALLEELARLRALEDEATQILSWLRTEGDEALKNHKNTQRFVDSVTDMKLLDQEFEKFYFSAMRQIDKVGDLLDVSNHCQSPRAKNFKDLAQILKQQISAFSDQLEDIRQRLEDTSRCFDLLARCQSTGEESKMDVITELCRLATKSGNEKLIEKSQLLNESTISHTCTPTRIPHPVEVVTSTPIRPTSGQHRRRSVSSFAFIYKCNHHAAGVSCDCWENDSEENTESAKLKKKYVQSLQSAPAQSNCACAKVTTITSSVTTLDRKNSLGLDNIKEVRESTEDLLETSEKNDSGLSGCGRCDSGLSTGNASSVCQGQDEGRNKKRVQRTCSCHFCHENSIQCSGGSSSSSGGSHVDHADHQHIEETDVFPKSNGSEVLEETEDQYTNDRNRSSIPPIAVNSHLHCHASNIDLPYFEDLSIDSNKQKTLLMIMREMIHTERDYVKSLYYVIENYIPELLREDIPQALRGQRNVVFGNIEKIYEFHSQEFLRELEQCENSPLHVGQIFCKHRNKFSLYALYNKNKPKSDSLLSEYGRTFFKSKQIQLKDNLDLASYLLKPVQRMGKYALLLQQLMKALPVLPEGASERALTEREDLKNAEEMVRFQLRHGNDLLAMDSIRDCDVNLKEQGRLLRQNEFLVTEGRGGKKSLRQVFLFEELILFSKARRFPDRKNLDLYIYKNSIKMTDIGLTARIGDSPTKFEIWFRKRKPNDTFILQSTSEEVKKFWIEELSKLLWQQAMKNREIRLQEMSHMGIGNKPCLDIRPSADNINDRSISIAQLSKTAPKFRNSIVGPVSELCRNSNRPHSIISVSSISSSSTSSQASSGTLGRHLPAAGNFDQVESPRTHHRSHTLNSQCSMESGIIADISIGSDDCPESTQLNNSSCWPLQKSNSQNSNNSITKFTNIIPLEEPQITLFHVPDDVPINI